MRILMLLFYMLTIHISTLKDQAAVDAADLQVGVPAFHVLHHVVLLDLVVGALGALPDPTNLRIGHLHHHALDQGEQV